MSVLNNRAQQELTVPERKAKRIKRNAKQSTDYLIQALTSSLRAIWQSDEPQDVLDALGTDAKELFELNTNALTFLFNELAGKRDDDLAIIMELTELIKPHTINEDGTVTVD